MSNLEARNAAQEATIDRLRVERGHVRAELAKAQERNEILQHIVNCLNERVAELECPKARAEKHFKGQKHG